MTLQWFLSRPVRHATSMCKHVRKLLNHQRDLLSAKAVEELESALKQARGVIHSKADKPTLEKEMKHLETVANKWLKPYPHAAFRENVEVLLVALAVAMGVRTFFLQPFKIPTGSMQPTLYGVTSSNLPPEFKIPTGLTRVKEWFAGTSYIHIVAPEDGVFEGAEPPTRLAIFNLHQTVRFNGKKIPIWFPPDYGSEHLYHPHPRLSRANVQMGQFFRKGEDIIKLKVTAGDHLFVDRVSYNFCAPDRGDIIVFETKGIEALTSDFGDTFYIKRLVGMGGETLELRQDYGVLGATSVAPPDYPVPVGHLVVDGKPLSASTRHFENLYSFHGANHKTETLRYEPNRYFGHSMPPPQFAPGNAPKYLRLGESYTVGTNSLFVMGDNTMNSSDSRYWGDFPKEKVIGKSFFVYWPITERFGWSSSY